SWFRELEEIAKEEASSASAAARPVPAGGARLEVYWPLDHDWYKGTVADVASTGQHHIQYDDGEEEWLQLSEELTRPERLEAEEDNDVAPVDEGTSALMERWRGELGMSRFTEPAVQMQEQALKETTPGNYGPKSEKFKDFCEGEGREWLPASEETARLYLAMLLDRGGIRPTSLQPYLSAFNNYHEDTGRPGPAKGRSVTRAVKGMTRLQVAASEATGVTATERTWLPAKDVRSENVLMNQDSVTVVLTREKGENHKLKKRQLSAAVQAYIDPMAVPDQAMRSYFGWLAPQGICAEEC
ncbi:hypothetical protein CYMTET_31535, partial [Cymbomonas tetramitiformis]